MGEKRGTKALELWCRRITDGYPGVNVQNMTTSWRDGLAFCAMIHHFRPDLIDFNSLHKDNVYGNNELAFRTAEQHLGIPALLDAEDMASCAVPDRLSILTYLSQFYQTFGGSSPSRPATNRSVNRSTNNESVEERMPPVTESSKSKVGMRRDPCTACGLPVFLAEKLLIARSPYHRTCFRCARCANQLTPGNYYETEEGQYCCETCPDEEEATCSLSPPNSPETTTTITQTDIMKPTTESVAEITAQTTAETTAEANAEVNEGTSITGNIMDSTDDALSLPDLVSQTSRMRLDFMANHLLLETTPSSEQDGSEQRETNTPQMESQMKDDMDVVFSYSCSNIDFKLTEKDNREDRYPSSSDMLYHRVVSNKPDTKEQLNSEDKEKEECSSLVKTRLQMFEERASFEKDTQLKRIGNVLRSDDKSKENVLSMPLTSTPCRPAPVSTAAAAAAAPLSRSPPPPIPPAPSCLTKKDPVEKYPEDLNPFKSEDEDEQDDEDTDEKYRTAMDKSQSIKVSANPFDSTDDEEEKKDVSPPKPSARISIGNKEKQQSVVVPAAKRRLVAPQINLNPFWSEDEEEEEEGNDVRAGDTDSKRSAVNNGNMPVPKPRTIRNTPELGVTRRKSDLDRGGVYASNSSITSSESASTPSGTYRKKKPAPAPPLNVSALSPSSRSTSSEHLTTSPRATPRIRKTKPAPPPPMPTSTPCDESIATRLALRESPINEVSDVSADAQHFNVWEDQKNNKDEANRSRQSSTPSFKSYSDKSMQGKWKRKKGPAPPRPIPHRRKIKVMSMKDVKLELDEIELQQQGLERQGVRLEQLIRDKCESGPRTDDSSLAVDVEELVLELFALVNEKNELFRRQAELMLLRRQQRLEEEHAEVEYQIRCLMCQPEATKTDFDKQKEEALIQRLVEIVERRNEIVECLEMDRKREVEEDKSIHKHMGLFAARNRNDISNSNEVDPNNVTKVKKGKIKEKLKERKFKKTCKKDADKDVDETEVKLKRHNKRRWF